MRQAFFFSLALFSFFSCSRKQAVSQEIMSVSKLAVQSFRIRIDKDTVVETASGMRIRIAAGGLVSSSATVTLRVQEAKRMGEMVKAGLLTHSKNGVLSSDGMFSIDFAEAVTIRKAMRVAYPTLFVNEKMQLYKGEEKGNGEMEWTDPIAIDSFRSPVTDAGKIIFAKNCASCHAIDKNLTGPALAWVDKRRSQDWLHAMVRNPAKLIKQDKTAACLYCKWQVLMTPFPLLPEGTTDAVFRYIDKASQQMNIPQDFNPDKECDSCGLYAARYRRLLTMKDSLLRRKQTMIKAEDAGTGGNAGVIAAPAVAPVALASTVTYPSFDAEYYQFDITSTGWYNIDVLLHNCDGVKQSQLMVRLQGSYQERVQLYLLIPSVKVFLEGGLLKDGKMYGFDAADGGMPLPQAVPAIVFGVSEKDKKLYYAETRFTTSMNQTVAVELKETSKTTILSSLSGLEISHAAIGTVTNKDDAVKLEEVSGEMEKVLPYLSGCACNSDTTITASE